MVCKQLWTTRKGKYADLGDFEMIKIPYNGNEYSMYSLVLRDTTSAYGTFNAVETLITNSLFDIRISKFKLQASTGRNPQNSGANSAAKIMYKTNFPKVSPNGYKFSNVFQVCNFVVNEEPTSASSGGTIIIIKGGGRP